MTTQPHDDEPFVTAHTSSDLSPAATEALEALAAVTKQQILCDFDHPHPEHPCAKKPEQPGEPCRFCQEPIPPTGGPCPHCWTSLDGMTTADIKALFAADADGRGDDEPVLDIRPQERP
ncbi:hypothetical protein [Streptomyces cyaneofuscatus]|uniref:hypothetical protein n=1 Tax=Streptomyces cyaneofuscatus TaxID=66883 RepID=UPI0033A366F4